MFSVASLAGGLAQPEGWLIVARGVQGLGGAIVSPAALSIITTTFADGSERNRALGVWGAVAGAGGAAGPGPRLPPESRNEDEGRSFDLLGAVTVTAGLVLLVYALVDTTNVGWGSTATLEKLAGAVILLVAFVFIERAQSQPLVRFSILRLRTLRGANIVGLLTGMSLFSMFFFISLYLQEVLHDSALTASISYLPLALLIILSAGLASQLVNRFGYKPI